MHAEPTTFGAKFALWACRPTGTASACARRARRVAVGKLSGAVGTYSNIDPRSRSYVCRALGLEPVPATQVIARDRHAEYLYACASAGATVELIATEVRHLARTRGGRGRGAVRRRAEGLLGHAPQAQPDPVRAARAAWPGCLRGYLIAGLEDVALWHERDISHSSVERVVLPDATLLTSTCCARPPAWSPAWSCTPSGRSTT